MPTFEIGERLKILANEVEVYRSFMANLQFSGLDINSIVITSCFPSEGKSVISFKLAYTLAENGKKVLFIDADMRKSVLLSNLGLKKKLLGLSTYLSDNTPLDKVIYSLTENLQIIPCGQYSYNPIVLLENNRFSELLEKFKSSCDYIVIDSPPMEGMADTSIIAKYCDACAFVVPSNEISHKVVNKNIKQLSTINPNFLGVILNKVDIHSLPYKRYYRSYYSKYYKYKYYNYYHKSKED